MQCVRFSPCGRYLASSGWDGLVLLWDVASGQQAAALEGHTDRVLGLAWSPDSRLLASCGYEEDRTVKLWSVDGRTCFATLREHGAAVHNVAFSPNGRVLASCGGDGVRLYDVATRVCTAKLEVSPRECAGGLRPALAGLPLALQPSGLIGTVTLRRGIGIGT